jgi:replicative DNA helicase
LSEEAILRRTLPNSIEAEQAVIGSMLIDQEAITVASEIVTEDDFYNRQCGILFAAMYELYREGKQVDPITLQDRLKEKDVPEETYSIEYITNIVDAVPTSANIRYYAGIVAEKSTLRRLIKLTGEIENNCYDGKENIEYILNDTEKRVFELVQRRNSDDFTPINKVVIEALARIEAAYRSGGDITGIPTGFIDLDFKTAGMQPSDLILIAARPSMGKTAFVLNIAQHMALRCNKSVAIFSLEMSKEQLVNRLFALEGTINAQNPRTGNLEPKEWDKLTEASNTIGESKIIIDDTSGISVQELRSKCRKYKLEKGLDCIIIDYLQLMSGNGRTESRQQEISEISRSLKGIARELNVPVIALSQLSRQVEQRPNKRPIMSDLRESGAIEQDADVVMFIYRDDYYNPDTDRKNISEIIIAKQRNGPIGTVELAWLPEYTKFGNLERKRKNSDNE